VLNVLNQKFRTVSLEKTCVIWPGPWTVSTEVVSECVSECNVVQLGTSDIIIFFNDQKVDVIKNYNAYVTSDSVLLLMSCSLQMFIKQAAVLCTG